MILILGGGLSGSLLGYQLSLLSPRPEFLLIEGNPQISQEHTWSFHTSDLSAHSWEWIRPLISQSWRRQEVIFPETRRLFEMGYHSIRSSEFAQKIKNTLQDHLILGDAITRVDEQEGTVYLQSGKSFSAQIIFDARGLSGLKLPPCGYQKFFGMDLELSQAHGLQHPIIMDTRASQEEGFYFFYVLPWSSHHLMIEATCYSNQASFDELLYKNSIELYCKSRNWSIERITRTEKAALPIPLQIPQLNPPLPSVISTESALSRVVPIGLKAGYFHLTTGYSLPWAVKVSEVIAEEIRATPHASAHAIKKTLKRETKELQRSLSFYAALNRMLFLASPPQNRIRIFSRFYQLNEDLIFRFYRGTLLRRDQLRILLGRPPVPLLMGLRHALNANETQCSWEGKTS